MVFPQAQAAKDFPEDLAVLIAGLRHAKGHNQGVVIVTSKYDYIQSSWTR